MNDIYLAPQAELVHAPSTDGYGSVERAVIGDYHFDIGEVINEAWEKTKGAKWPILLALGLYVLVYMVIMSITQFLFSALGLTVIPDSDGSNISTFMGYNFLQNMIVTVATMPMMIGVFILGLRRAMDAPLAATSIMRHYDKTVPLALTLLLMYAILTIGFVLFIVPGIYLSVAYYLAMPLVVEKGLGPWEALETSRRAISKRWFSVFGLGVVVVLINMLGGFAFGVGLIWTLPFTAIAFGILYRNMFGCEAATVTD